MSDTTRNKGIRKRPAPIDPEEGSAYKRPAVYGRTASVVPAASVPTVAQEVPAVHDLYTPRSDAIAELHNLELPGEVTGEFEERPTRLIRQLIAYGPPRPGNSSRILVPFSEFEKKERKRAGFVIEGLVSALPKTDEDFEFDDEDEETTIRMRLDKVEQVSMNLDLFNDPVRIETPEATYLVESIHVDYRVHYEKYYFPRKCTQAVLVMIQRNKSKDMATFTREFKLISDQGTSLYTWIDDDHTKSYLKNVVLQTDPSLLGNDVIKKLTQGAGDSSDIPLQRPRVKAIPRNADLAALDPAGQTKLAVTARIHELSKPWMQLVDKPTVLGSGRPPDNSDMKSAITGRERAERSILLQALQASNQAHRRFAIPAESRNQPYMKSVMVNGILYKLDEINPEDPQATVVIVAGDNVDESRRPRTDADLPPGSSIGEWFWLARILYIDADQQRFHVQFLLPGSHTALGEIHEPRELFLTGCQDIPCNTVVGKAGLVSFLKPGVSTPGDYKAVRPSADGLLQYYCRFNYSGSGGAFFDVDMHTQMLDDHLDIDVHRGRCRHCMKLREAEERQRFKVVDDSTFSFRNQDYHVNDIICIYSEHSPASQVARVSRIIRKKRNEAECRIEVVLFARMTDAALPSDKRDQHHLIATGCSTTIPYHWALRKVYVIHETEVPAVAEASPDHHLPPDVFYVSHSAPTARFGPNGLECVASACVPISCNTVKSWRLGHEQCLQQYCTELGVERDFVQSNKLKTLDLFAGVGAFSLGMKDNAGFNITHAIEIGPSTAETLRQNSPDVITYAACANEVLRDCIRHRDFNERGSKDTNVLKHAPLPISGHFDAVVAGFPCQSQSTLNMYRSEQSSKSFLVLNLLSYVDAIRPKYCVFENVRGIFHWRLMAARQSAYTTTGGIPMGGLKLVLRCLVDLGYQIRYGILQAANFGAPQDRERFFLIAALSGNPLPPTLAQPTHYSPYRKSINMKLQENQSTLSTAVDKGTALFPPVTIGDAIDDLVRFSWGAFHKTPSAGEVSVGEGVDFWGPQVTNAYGHAARTTFQKKCRSGGPVQHLQHYTRTFDAKVVERVRGVPIKPNADYRALTRNLWEWQGAQASSARARDGFPPGLYGRLGSDDQFRTIVANVSPTAKQSWVLHYQDKRIFTVRELARSQGFPDCFSFYADKTRVETVSSQTNIREYVTEAIGRSIGKTRFKHHLEKRIQPGPQEDSDDDLYM